MIALLLALAMQSTQAASTAGFTGETGIRIDSTGRCIITKLSGDPTADLRSCEILLQCVAGKRDLKRALSECKATAPPRDRRSSIDIPYQIMPAYSEYGACVGAQLKKDYRHGSADLTSARQANIDAIAACKTSRAYQLARALRMQTDHRLYGSRKNAEAAVRRAFDRFDVDFVVEPITGKTDASN